MSNYRLLAGLLALSFLYPTAAGVIRADSEPIGAEQRVGIIRVADTALMAVAKTPRRQALAMAITQQAKPAARATRLVNVSAYSSTPEETDSTPFVTALGTRVRDGVIAANFLPFGAKVRIPSIYGAKVFVVEDRMNTRYANHVDIWMVSKSLALQFGRKDVQIEILD